MKSITMCNTITINGCEYPINTNASKGQGCYIEILEAIERNLTAMLSHHSRVYVAQFVVHTHDFEHLNTGMSKLMKVIKRRLKTKYKLVRIAGGWVRETGASQLQHYHAALFVDGNSIWRLGGVQALVTEILEMRNYPRPSFCAPHMVTRGVRHTFEEAFMHLSYLAKTRSKGKKAPTTNDYSFSRLKAKSDVNA